MNEEWIDVKERLPKIGQRVRVLVVKELIYEGESDEKDSLWKYDQEGEHGIYCWSEQVKNKPRA